MSSNTSFAVSSWFTGEICSAAVFANPCVPFSLTLFFRSLFLTESPEAVKGVERLSVLRLRTVIAEGPA